MPSARPSAIVVLACLAVATPPALATRQAPSDAAAPAQGQPAAAQPAHFKGAIALPNGMSLDFTVRLTRDHDGSPRGTIDIPVQGVEDFPLSDVVWDARSLAFVMELPGVPESGWPRFAYTLSPGSTSHTGTLDQAGMRLDATIEALDAAPEGPRRPQLPQAPFPYDAREVTFQNPGAALTIAGTLTVPEGEGPFPCAVLITGSGAQDRDETLMGHQPFLVIADHLSRHGIAVLRCDDRGVGGTGVGTPEDPDSFDFATDIRAALTFLESQPGIDPARLGLIGHSEGGLIGPIVAADDPRVSFLVLLAGPGVPGSEVLIRQSAELARAGGTPEERIEAQRPVRESLFRAVAAGEADAAREHLVTLLRQEMPGVEESMIQQSADAQSAFLNSRWMRTFISHDPRPTLRRVACPVLVLNGDLDLQVLADQNVPEVVRALGEGGNDRVTTHVLPGLNHLFQPATTGSVTEYATIETTFDPATLAIIADWITAHTR